MDKHSSLLLKFVNYGQKSFITLAAGDDQDPPEVPERSVRPLPAGRNGSGRGADGRAEEGQVAVA